MRKETTQVPSVRIGSPNSLKSHQQARKRRSYWVYLVTRSCVAYSKRGRQGFFVLQEIESLNEVYHQCNYCAKRYVGVYGRSNLKAHVKAKHSSLTNSKPFVGVPLIIQLQEGHDPKQVPAISTLNHCKTLNQSVTARTNKSADSSSSSWFLISVDVQLCFARLSVIFFFLQHRQRHSENFFSVNTFSTHSTLQCSWLYSCDSWRRYRWWKE